MISEMANEVTSVCRAIGLLIVYLIFMPIVDAQVVDPDNIDFTTASQWPDLPSCLRRVFDAGFSGDPVLQGCGTNKCICSPSRLGSGIKIVQDESLRSCSNLDDQKTAREVFVGYCSSHGYTSIVTPVVLPPTSGACTVTATVTQTVASRAVNNRTPTATGLETSVPISFSPPSPQSDCLTAIVALSLLLLVLRALVDGD